MAGISPRTLASTKRLTRSSSVTTWRARRRTRAGSSAASCSNRAGVTSRRLSTPSAAAGGGALAHSFAVGGAGELVLHHGVHGDERDAVGQRNGAVAEAAAIDFDRGVLASEDGDVLVHDAAGHADEIAFGALAEPGQFERLDRAADQQGERSGDFERGRRTQPGAFRHRAADQQVGALHGVAERAPVPAATPIA